MELGIGDVLCTRGGGWVSKVIRIGAVLQNRGADVGHVAVYVGEGSDGRPRVIEGRPGGVGYRDAKSYLKDHWTIDNRAQPKTEEQRALVLDGAVAMLGTPYDWVGIGQDAMLAIDAPHIYDKAVKDGAPSPDHVVCSSLADWLYHKAMLASPGPKHWDRHTTPGDWAEFIIAKAWK